MIYSISGPGEKVTLVLGMRDGTKREGYAVSKIENPNLSSVIWIGREPWPRPSLVCHGCSRMLRV